MIEEILEALEPDTAQEVSYADEDEEEVVLAVSTKCMKGEERRRTMRLHGTIGKLHVLILIDSGSVGTFISPELASQLKVAVEQCPSIQLVAADGSPMLCDKRIPNLQWSSQGHTFTSSAGILPIKCFDMILGEDWLEDHNPMWVHWGKKVMKFTHEGRRIVLQGLTKRMQSCSAFEPQGLRGLLNRQAVSHCVQLKLLPADPDLSLDSEWAASSWP